MLDFIKQLDNLINENIPRMHGDFLNVVAMTSTKLVSFYFLALLFVFLIVAIKSKKDVIYLYVGSCLIVLINYILKNTIQRQRPTGVRLIVEKGYSFPSAHAMLSAFIYGFIAYLIYKKINNSKRKYVVLLAFSLLILWIGFTRIYLGVHYFSDVIAGFLLGTAYFMIFLTIIKAVDKK